MLLLLLFSFHLNIIPDTIPDDLPLLQPVRKSDFKYISSPFGWRTDPVSGKRNFHRGRDIVCHSPNAPVYATGNGIVEVVGKGKRSGLYVLVRHGYGYQTRYAHLGEVLVEEGQKLRAGDRIGKIGKTGRVTGAHLHYEVLRDGACVDPGEIIY